MHYILRVHPSMRQRYPEAISTAIAILFSSSSVSIARISLCTSLAFAFVLSHIPMFPVQLLSAYPVAEMAMSRLTLLTQAASPFFSLQPQDPSYQ